MSYRLRLPARPPGEHTLFRGCAAVLLVAVCVLLGPLAAASPADPSWISGLYDDSDFDNVVGFIGSLFCVSDAPEADVAGPDQHEAGLAHSGSRSPDSASVLTLLARSPPHL